MPAVRRLERAAGTSPSRLSQILFPILVMLGTTGMVVGILNSYNRFGAFAISPFFWNVAIIGVAGGMRPLFHGDDKIYAYAIGVLVGTAIQLAIPAWDLRHTPFACCGSSTGEASTCGGCCC